MQGSQELPPKDLAVFRQLVKLYEAKQYKKGVKTADSILKHHPDHGETLCMKGLMLNSLDQKEEAYQLAKLGLKKNLKSHVCWHVLGLLYRSDRNYAEATKCYRSALRMDPNNGQIMRDLSLLQLHERDLAGYTETRRQLLGAKPGVKQNWLSYAIAEHLRGSPKSALEVIEKMEESFGPTEEPLGPVEKSELILYKATLALEANDLEKAALLGNSKEVVDSVGKNELLVLIHFTQGNMEAAKVVLADLLKINVHHEGYLQCLLACEGLVSASVDQVKTFLNLPGCLDSVEHLVGTVEPNKLEELGKAYNLEKSDQWSVLALLLLPVQSPQFASQLERFVFGKLEKGVPSLFKMLRRLYAQNKGEKVKSVFEKAATASQNPMVQTFALTCLAAHFDFVKDYEESLGKIEEALAITPTLIDLYVLKAKVLKHAGRLVESSAVWEEARCMDLADRYLNSKCVKSLLRVGEIEKAKSTIMLFAKDSVDASKSNLHEMQCTWWELELAAALKKSGQVEEALSIVKGTLKHFEDMREDEFDFAFYCLRKATLRAYIDFLRTQDSLKQGKVYKLAQKLFEELTSAGPPTQG